MYKLSSAPLSVLSALSALPVSGTCGGRNPLHYRVVAPQLIHSGVEGAFALPEPGVEG